MMGLLFNKYALLGFGLAAYSAALWTGGFYTARQEAEMQVRQDLITQLKERNETDAKIENMDDAGLCGLLGGVWNGEGECE